MNLETIGGTLISIFETVGETPAVDFLQSIHDKNLKFWRVIIYDADYGLELERSRAVKTATSLDDKLVTAFQTIITASALKNGITL